MNSKKINRVEGQLWIEKDYPYNLRYFVNNTNYSVAPSAMYTYESNESKDPHVDPGSIILPAGSVVKFAGSNKLEKALFPDDLESVLGVTTADLIKGDGFNIPITVAQDGYVIIDHPEKVFATTEDLLLTPAGNNYTSTTIIGKPIYWFIGRVGKNKSYISPIGKEGMLTFATPAGFESNNISDNSLNIAYDNLPQIGTVANIETSGNTITKIRIHLNFSKFDSSLEWNWPRLSNNNCGKIKCEVAKGKVTEKEINIKHGLFPIESNYLSRCFIDVTANPVSENNIDLSKEYNIDTDVYNDYSNEMSVVRIKNPEEMFYKISGRINYKFDKNHK